MGTIYLYAVMAGEPQLNLGSIGLPDGSTAVDTLVADGLTAVVSEYSGPPLEELPKPAYLARLLLHQQVLEKIVAHHTALPVRFGTVLRSVDDARTVVTRYRSQLIEALEEMGNAVEIDLSATWDLSAVLDTIKAGPAIAELKNAAGESPQDALAAAIEAGSLAQRALEQQREAYRRRVVSGLARFVQDAEPHALPSDETVFNIAFLVERGDLEAFDSTLEEMGPSFEPSLSFRYVGPLPPYSFATVEISYPNAAAIETARQLLGLGERATHSELRASYRRLAAESHPDRNHSNPDAQERFAALVSAHDTLSDYMQQVDEEPVDLRRDAVAGNLLLRISRADAQAKGQHERNAVAI